MITLLAITVFVALVSFNVTKTQLLRPLRVALARHTPRRLRQVWRCHYCLSHHVAWATLLVAGWHYPFGTRLDPVLTWAAVVVLAGPVMTCIDWAIEAMDNFKRVFRIQDAVPAPRAFALENGVNGHSAHNGRSAQNGHSAPDSHHGEYGHTRHWDPERLVGDRGERLRSAGGLPPSN